MVLLTKSCPSPKNNSDTEQKRTSVAQPWMSFSALYRLNQFRCAPYPSQTIEVRLLLCQSVGYHVEWRQHTGCRAMPRNRVVSWVVVALAIPVCCLPRRALPYGAILRCRYASSPFVQVAAPPALPSICASSVVPVVFALIGVPMRHSRRVAALKPGLLGAYYVLPGLSNPSQAYLAQATCCMVGTHKRTTQLPVA